MVLLVVLLRDDPQVVSHRWWRRKSSHQSCEAKNYCLVLCFGAGHISQWWIFKIIMKFSILSLITADSTGSHSVYAVYQGNEIMFHVSTMLPYTPNNRQQVKTLSLLKTSDWSILWRASSYSAYLVTSLMLSYLCAMGIKDHVHILNTFYIISNEIF